jgi:hypothetical protein
MERQTAATKIAAEAAKTSADVAWRSLKVMYRVYLRVDKWKPFLGGHGTDDTEIHFRIFNPSITAAKIEEISYIDLGGNKIDKSDACPITLAPREKYWVTICPDEITWFQRNDDLAAAIRVEIVYSDGFTLGRRRRFAKDCVCRGPGTDPECFLFINPKTSGLNYEDEDDYWYSEGQKNPN